MGLADYHMHTLRCGHATGTPAQYVEQAVRRGLSEIGFSDHAPLPEHLRNGITMAPDEVESYLDDLAALGSRYKGSMIIRTGFEVDFPLHPTFDRSLLTDPRIDYLIGSCHFLDEWPFDHPDFVDEFDRRDINDIYAAYYSMLGDLADSRMFQILGHMDLVKKFGHRAKRDFSREVELLAKKLKASGIAVEINTAGLLKPVAEMYPAREIVGILFRQDVPVTLGSDAHTPENVGYAFDSAVDMIRTAGYRYISGFTKRKRHDIPL